MPEAGVPSFFRYPGNGKCLKGHTGEDHREEWMRCEEDEK